MLYITKVEEIQNKLYILVWLLQILGEDGILFCFQANKLAYWTSEIVSSLQLDMEEKREDKKVEKKIQYNTKNVEKSWKKTSQSKNLPLVILYEMRKITRHC
jgi:hypothetical protein